MNLYPAIDLYENKVVRLQKGDFKRMTVYHDRPSETARIWEDQGAEWLHLVNLNGARDGRLENLEALSKIRESVNCRIQFGGGIRSADDIRTLLGLGVERVILGSRALEPRFLQSVFEQFPYRVAVGFDVMDGVVKTHGWLSGSGVRLDSALRSLHGFAPAAVIVTDIHKDGMLQGPNFDMIRECLGLARFPIILSGGISDLSDIAQCAALKHPFFDGAIIGKALYEKKFSLASAFDQISRKEVV
ncbi:MAG TPA: 1-(5-phosphoribosyl)-5-[(5-phosphoribosylamino)methylideneamino]imidazole-4-carboxamide isomerase [Candidatus Omnitrophota bacterium]|nr:1-(5-phosphoribosyl)-5-[(5-phosphoribosylamino)methylideneamino]imidazole-4-carboxamide isomerase [Candidatus Omnitrophota bacterium]